MEILSQTEQEDMRVRAKRIKHVLTAMGPVMVDDVPDHLDRIVSIAQDSARYLGKEQLEALQQLGVLAIESPEQ